MTTLCLQLKGTDPCLNLASEEYLLKNYTSNILMIWRSQSAVIVGKHQNALAEINHQYVRQNSICVARRLSGGGTVFHDEGNLNFTFIKNVDRVDQINYSLFTGIMIGILKKLELNVSANQHNALFLENKKISGSADHVHKLRVMHHGTLLFDSRLDRLKAALKTDLSKFEGKAIQSNRSEVTNIADHLSAKMEIEEFEKFIFDQICRIYPDCQVAELTPEDLNTIEKLKSEKYVQWNWTYGYSPKYKYHNRINAADKELSFTLPVEKGKITEPTFEGDISQGLALDLIATLKGRNHDYDVLKPLLISMEPRLSHEGFPAAQLLDKII